MLHVICYMLYGTYGSLFISSLAIHWKSAVHAECGMRDAGMRATATATAKKIIF